MSLRALSAFSVLITLTLPPTSRAATLFDDLGGKPGMSRLVEEAVNTFTSDPRIGPVFDESNISRFKVKLYEQFCQVTGGGCVYTGHSMYETHRGLHLVAYQFNVVVEDLQQAMEKLNIPFSTQNRLLAVLAPMYRDVVTK